MSDSSGGCSATRPRAVIDIGTNTLRLLIGYRQGGRLVRLASDRAVTRLGKDLLHTGDLCDESIDKSIESLIAFKDECKRFAVTSIDAVGTSALRDARNSAAFIRKVEDRTGIPIEVISGEKEAELTVKGILGYRAEAPVMPPFFITDIGGGSTEWIYYGDSVIMGSLQIGAVRLLGMFLKHDPPAHDELNAAKNHISEHVASSLVMHGIKPPLDALKPGRLLATGGTATTLAAIDLHLEDYDGDRVHLHEISRPSLRVLLEKLSYMSLNQREKVQGIGRGRADIIIPGTLILLVIMELLGADRVTVSDYGLLEGLLMDKCGPIPDA